MNDTAIDSSNNVPSLGKECEAMLRGHKTCRLPPHIRQPYQQMQSLQRQQQRKHPFHPLSCPKHIVLCPSLADSRHRVWPSGQLLLVLRAHHLRDNFKRDISISFITVNTPCIPGLSFHVSNELSSF